MIGSTIKHARKSKGLTQTELGEMAKLTQPHIARIEANEDNVTLRAIHSVINALQISNSDIVSAEVMRLDEINLLQAFRLLNLEDQRSVLRHAEALAENKEIRRVIK